MRLIARGRASELFDLGDGRVLRRANGRADYRREASVMRHVRGFGYPAPAVVDVLPDGLVLERVAGPTMAEELRRRPDTGMHHAAILAGLHDRLHEIVAPD